MSMTIKGIKMNISKCLKNFDIEKSEELTTEVRGKHELTNGYHFEDLEDGRIVMTWIDDSLDDIQKVEKLKVIFETLDRHGFADYMHLNEENASIELDNFTY